MITYKKTPQGNIGVYLDRKRVGTIVLHAGRYRYELFASDYRGEWFDSLDEVKASIEGND